jgi:hypothetical protein
MNTTTTRRSAVGFSLSALAASLSVPAIAMARAAVPHIARGVDGTFDFTDISEWMTVRVAEFPAGSCVAY